MAAIAALSAGGFQPPALGPLATGASTMTPWASASARQSSRTARAAASASAGLPGEPCRTSSNGQARWASYCGGTRRW